MKNYLLRRRILEFVPDNQMALSFPDLVITYIILEDDDAHLVTYQIYTNYKSAIHGALKKE